MSPQVGENEVGQVPRSRRSHRPRCLNPILIRASLRVCHSALATYRTTTFRSTPASVMPSGRTDHFCQLAVRQLQVHVPDRGCEFWTPQLNFVPHAQLPGVQLEAAHLEPLTTASMPFLLTLSPFLLTLSSLLMSTRQRRLSSLLADSHDP